ncbi:MAG: cupredoxin domain-containing protein [Candidatus Paceibacterota bacterium]|jgi:plastocyanin
MITENKKYVGYLLIIIVVVLGIYFINKKDNAPGQAPNDIVATTSPTTAATAGGVKQAASKPVSYGGAQVVVKDGMYIVSYENTGFNPKKLEINRGKSVRFVNNSTKAMRVGDTTNIPAFQAFNQPKTVGKGGTYEYTFNDVGTYEYANQNNTADKGTIVVR